MEQLSSHKDRKGLDWRVPITLGVAGLAGIEIALLEIKYQILSGHGFLQSSPLSGATEKGLFLALYAGGLAMLFWAFGYLFRWVARHVGQDPSRAAFSAGALFILIYGIALLASFQLHRYLADHIEMSVLAEIAGGSLGTALGYVANELVVFLAPVLVAVGLFLLLYRLIRPGGNPSTERWVLRLGFLALFLAVFVAVEFGASYPLKHNLGRAVGYGLMQTAAHRIADVDGDGSSVFSIPRDSAPFDSSIFWGAVDLPGNGVDENGLGGDLPAEPSGNPGNVESHPLAPGYRHLVLIVSESTRADLVGKQLDGRLVAPNLTGLARTGSSVDRAYSHAGFTASSLYSLFSGRYTFREGTPSVLQDAHAAGMELSIISGQDESWGGLDDKLQSRNLATFFYDPQVEPEKRVFPSRLPASIKLAEEDLLAAFRTRLEDIDWNRRQFFYLNFQAGHFPYAHTRMPPAFIEQPISRGAIGPDEHERLQRTYWNAMAYMDSHLGEVIGALRTAGIWRETLLVFLGDHGESLFHDGTLGHGQTINDDQLRIPLVLSAPGINFQSPVGLVDVASWLRGFVRGPGATFDKRGDCVLMYTGPFHRPGQVGRACRGSEELEVYTVRQRQFSGPGNPETASLALIHSWERALHRMSL